MTRIITTLSVGLLLTACASQPEREKREILFQDGPEFAAAHAFTMSALDSWDSALMASNTIERDRHLEAADGACRQAQLQYEQAMKVYSQYQRDEIETEMAAVHRHRMAIERERYR